MARKSRDLFEVLGARSRGGAQNGGGFVKRVQEFVSPQPASHAKKRAAKGAGPAANGLVIAAVAFGALVVGFLGGRWSVSTEAAGDLNVQNRSGEFGVRPARFGAAQSRLTDDNLREKLSTWGHYLLGFPIPDTPGGEQAAFDDAKQLVHWLWDRGFERVRIDHRRSSKRDQSYWVVLNYVDSETDTADWLRLSELESPEFAPGFAEFVAGQSKIRSL